MEELSAEGTSTKWGGGGAGGCAGDAVGCGGVQT